MRTPAGKECQYFYGDYFRGRQIEECRLLKAATPPQIWSPDLCRTCPVPGITLANACPQMTLEARAARPFPFLKRQVLVRVSCRKTSRRDFDPHIGCGECHPLPPIFGGTGHEPDSSV
jgi:hypothetical protein